MRSRSTSPTLVALGISSTRRSTITRNRDSRFVLPANCKGTSQINFRRRAASSPTTSTGTAWSKVALTSSAIATWACRVSGRMTVPSSRYVVCLGTSGSREGSTRSSGVAGDDRVADAELLFPCALDLLTIEQSAALAVEVFDPVEAALFPDSTVRPGDLLVGRKVKDGIRLIVVSSEHYVRFPSFPGFLGIAIAEYDSHEFSQGTGNGSSILPARSQALQTPWEGTRNRTVRSTFFGELQAPSHRRVKRIALPSNRRRCTKMTGRTRPVENARHISSVRTPTFNPSVRC